MVEIFNAEASAPPNQRCSERLLAASAPQDSTQTSVVNATKVFLESAATKFGEENIKKVHIDKSDWAAAFSLYVCGPDIYKSMGHDTAQALGKTAALFAVAPAFGVGAEISKSTHDLQNLGFEASASALVGYGAGFLTKYIPGAGPVLAATGTAALLNEQFLSPSNQARNTHLAKTFGTINKMNDKELIDAARANAKYLGSDIFHGAVGVLCGAGGFKKGEILGSAARESLPPSTLSAASANVIKTVIPKIEAKAISTDGIKIPIPKSVEKNPLFLAMERERDYNGNNYGKWTGGPLAPEKILSDEQLTTMPFSKKVELIEKTLYQGDLRKAYQIGNQILEWKTERGCDTFRDAESKAIFNLNMIIRNIAEEGVKKWAPKLTEVLNEARNARSEVPTWPLKVLPENLCTSDRIRRLPLPECVNEIEALAKAKLYQDAGKLAQAHNLLYKRSRNPTDVLLEEMFNDVAAIYFALKRGYSWANEEEAKTSLKYIRILGR